MANVHGDGDHNGGTPPATTPRDTVLNPGLGVPSSGGGRMPIQEGSFADTGAAQGRSEEHYFLEERQSGGRNDTDEIGRRIPIAGDPSARTPASPVSTGARVWQGTHEHAPQEREQRVSPRRMFKSLSQEHVHEFQRESYLRARCRAATRAALAAHEHEVAYRKACIQSESDELDALGRTTRAASLAPPSARGRVHDGLLRYVQRSAVMGLKMRTNEPTPTEPRVVEAHSSVALVIAIAWLWDYKVGQAVGEMIFFSDASAEYLQDAYCSPLAAVEKSDPSTGMMTGEFRLITDMRSDKDGKPGPNTFVDKSLYPPTVCPSHKDVALMIRMEAYTWPGLPIPQAKRDAIKAFQQLVTSLSRVNFACTRLASLFPSRSSEFPAVTVVTSAAPFGSNSSPASWCAVSSLALGLVRAAGLHPDDHHLAPSVPQTGTIYVDDAFDATAAVGAGARSVLSVWAIESAMRCIVQGKDNTILNAEKMVKEGHAATVHRCWGTTSSTEGMELDPHNGFFEYPLDKRQKFLRMLLAPSGQAGAREVSTVDHMKLQGVGLQVARLSTVAKAALGGLSQSRTVPACDWDRGGGAAGVGGVRRVESVVAVGGSRRNGAAHGVASVLLRGLPCQV